MSHDRHEKKTVSQRSYHPKASRPLSSPSSRDGISAHAREQARAGTMLIGIVTVLAVVVIIAGIIFAIVLNTHRNASAKEDGTSLIGTQAPGFSLKSTDGQRVSLKDFKGKKPVLLYFSEGAGCQACIVQMASIEQEAAQFKQANITVVPIVMDSRETIKQAMKQYGVVTPFLLDDGTVSSAYKTLGKGMHSDLPGHEFILVDKQGVIRWDKNYQNMWAQPADLLKQLRTALKSDD